MSTLLAPALGLHATARKDSVVPEVTVCVGMPRKPALRGDAIAAVSSKTLLKGFDPFQQMTHHLECVGERGFLPVLNVSVASNRHAHRRSLEPGELASIVNVLVVGLALHVFAHVRTLAAGVLR